jgi:ribokinase
VTNPQSAPASGAHIRNPQYILSIGDLLLDVVVRYDPVSNEADTGPDGVQLWPGGSAANFAVWAARQGATVRYVTCVGRDLSGEMLRRTLDEPGIIPQVRISDDEPTGRVLVMIDEVGNRRMWSYPGASATIRPSDLDPQWFDNLDAFHLTGYSLLREGPRAAAHEGLRLARASGTTLCTLDPNPPHLMEDYGASAFRDLLTDLQFDIIFPNLDEAGLLSMATEPEAMAADLLALSPIVVLKLAEQGCVIATRNGLMQHIPPAPVEVVRDATGAGDAFAAAFTVEYLASRDLQRAGQAANRLAAEVVGRVGAR